MIYKLLNQLEEYCKLSDEEILSIATNKYLPKGYKAEDYFCVNKELSITIAREISKEYFHIKKITEKYNSLTVQRLNWWNKLIEFM